MAELFAGLQGQAAAVQLLCAALDRGRIAPAYLFSGPEGVGRRQAALRFLEGLLCPPELRLSGDPALRRRLLQGNHPDLLWVEPTYSHQGQLVAASQAEAAGVSRRTPPQIRLEQVREVSRFLARTPVEGDRTLVVLEEAESMAEGAANALLKTLEEPLEGLLLLITAAPERLLGTIRSRCQLIPFRRLSPDCMAAVLAEIGATTASTGSALAVAEQDSPELLELAAGSPGALLRHRRHWRALPDGLAERLLATERTPVEALGLARDLCEALDGEDQLWLLEWWQLALWRRNPQPQRVRRLERLRSQLRAHVQPRLAWEVALLEISGR